MVKQTVSVKYQKLEFTPEEMEKLEAYFFKYVPIEKRTAGIFLKYKERLFQLTGVIFDIDTETRIYELVQVTTKNKIAIA